VALQDSRREGDVAVEPAKLDGEGYRLRAQAETNLLNWIRTSLALMGFGFVIARFGLFLRELAQVAQGDHAPIHQHPQLAVLNSIAGTVLILLGVVVLLAAVRLHQGFLAALDRGELRMPSRWSLAVVLSLVLAALGVAIAVYLTVVQF
jgi:putative membrane protein